MGREQGLVINDRPKRLSISVWALSAFWILHAHGVGEDRDSRDSPLSLLRSPATVILACLSFRTTNHHTTTKTMR